MYFKVTIKFQKGQENGKLKNVSESYLLKVDSYTDAEELAIKELNTSQDDFTIKAIKEEKIGSVYVLPAAEANGNDTAFFKIKDLVIVQSENKKSKLVFKKFYGFTLIQAKSAEDAMIHFVDIHSSDMNKAEIVQVSKTNILEIVEAVQEVTESKEEGVF